ncbi:hypothetical protein GGR58DRAFT_496002 [Xylaria digitata]|nr:hypothetical protein GGR58DRAFT_496002 [Xylaria digitata]
MSRFDPTKPIDDPTVWYPNPDLWVKTNPTRSDDGDDDQAFALDSSDFAALNRYVWTAKLLPTDREFYKNVIGIVANDELPSNVWATADKVIETYGVMQKEADTFLSTTWEDLVTVSNKIFSYAQDAGGDEELEDPNRETSYYRAMLTWVTDWNNENDKDNPDQKKLDELQKNIQDATKDEIKNADNLQQKTDTARQALGVFHDACKEHQSDLEGKSKTLMNLLEGEDGIIAQLNDEIAEYVEEIEDLNKEIEQDRKKIRETAYYVWLPMIGTIAGVTVDIMAENDIKRLRAAIENIQSRISQDKVKLQSAMRMSSDIKSMGTHMDNLVDAIQPAIATLEKIQGAWGAMSADLQSLHDLFEGHIDRIPGITLERLQLNQIVAHWNTLRDDVDIFRKNAYMTTEPPRDTIEDFLKKLDEKSASK